MAEQEKDHQEGFLEGYEMAQKEAEEKEDILKDAIWDANSAIAQALVALHEAGQALSATGKVLDELFFAVAKEEKPPGQAFTMEVQYSDEFLERNPELKKELE